jgi:hypothetical protein
MVLGFKETLDEATSQIRIQSICGKLRASAYRTNGIRRNGVFKLRKIQTTDARPNLAVPYQAPPAASSDQTTTADPISGTETLGRATDLSEGRVLSTISCYGDDLSAVHSTFQRLRGCRFSSGDLASSCRRSSNGAGVVLILADSGLDGPP